MRTHALILLFLLLCLTACGTERVVLKPEIVEIAGPTKWVEIPDDLVMQEPLIAIPDGATYGDLIEILGLERASKIRLNGRLAGIDSLGDDDDGISDIP